MKKKLLLLVAAMSVFCATGVYAQTFVHGRSKTYEAPKDAEVIKNLDKWEDQKFGMLIHYGLYSYLGISESWPLVGEEEDWIKRDPNISYEEFKRRYWGAISFFNPVDFNPEQWADYGTKAGMKYMVFTTKHHDGFNMYDTKYTDFSITKGAFRDHPRKNIAKEVFSAFGEKGYMIGAYYSKPDWHSQDYWWDRYPTSTRNNNYTISMHPERWNRFKQFCYNQIEELMNGDYGKIDILWLDGGQVQPAKEGDEIRYGGAYKTYKGSQDIDMPRIAKMARSYQPSLLVVDRTVPGEFENYQTPEQGIPDMQLSNPWESCITLSDSWGFRPGDEFKSPTWVVHTLIEIVAKGGNLLLGVGPHPDGTLHEDITSRLEKIGEWVNKNGKAIYGTRNTPNYVDKESNTWFTQSKDGNTIYSMTCLEEGKTLPKTITWKGNEPAKGSTMTFVETGKSVSWEKLKNGNIQISVPAGLPKDQAALAFSFKVAK